jgi:uncharacterized protein YukE
MTDNDGPDDHAAIRWVQALRQLERSGVFQAAQDNGDDRLPSLWLRLRDSGHVGTSADVIELAGLLSLVASFSPRPSDWASPYEPMINMIDGRSAIPDDLTEHQANVLIAIAPELPDPLLRARVSDVLALRATGRQRLMWYEAEMKAVIEATLSRETWLSDRDAWDRALLIGRRHGSALQSSLETLVSALTDGMLSAAPSPFLGSVADVLAKHNLARDRASDIAARLRDLASTAESEAARGYRSRAARWHQVAGELDEALADQEAVVRSLISEAELLDAQAQSNADPRSAFLYERALKALREIPRRRREELGLGEFTTELASRIRAAGAATLGTMGVIRSESVDLSDTRRLSVSAVSGKAPLDALRAFVRLIPIVSYADERAHAEKSLAEFPLQSLFSNVHYSHDGRVIHRSGGQGGEPIFGEDPATWRQMIQSYEFRISMGVQGSLSPAWMALSNEHRLTTGDFLEITRGSSIVPADRERLIAQALYYGYNGDFITAAQLLAPQIEHIVRLHLRNAGQRTSTLENGIEQEIGLTALMAREAVTEIFGEDIVLEIRALFCGPIGPNLRNEFAHGLVSDASVGSVHAFYCWWFVLFLTFVPFWNRLHDAATADSHEPAERAESEDEQDE